MPDEEKPTGVSGGLKSSGERADVGLKRFQRRFFGVVVVRAFGQPLTTCTGDHPRRTVIAKRSACVFGQYIVDDDPFSVAEPKP